MSGKRTKKLRAAFEMRNGYTALQREHEIYKKHWRKFKKDFLPGNMIITGVK